MDTKLSKIDGYDWQLAPGFVRDPSTKGQESNTRDGALGSSDWTL